MGFVASSQGLYKHSVQPLDMKRVQVRDFNKNTHEMKDYLKIYRRLYAKQIGIPIKNFFDMFDQKPDTMEITIDPFARDCEWAYPHTNDTNPFTKAVNNWDALTFLESYEPSSFSIGLLDPPFSDRMAKDKYGTANLYAADSSKMRKIELALGNVIATGGCIIKLGYNSSKPHPSFVCEDIELWNLGACRQDIIVSVWRKTNSSLEEWL